MDTVHECDRRTDGRSGIVENCDFRFIRSLTSEHFTYMAIRQLSGDTTVNDLGHISRSLDCCTSNFSKTVVWYGKSYYRLLIGNHTLAFDWCYFWWPWSTFEGHFSLGCHFHVHFSYPWNAFASHGLPAIAELLVLFGRQQNKPMRSDQNVLLFMYSVQNQRPLGS